MATAETTRLLTAEEFATRPDPGYPEELVRGRVVAMSVPDPRHGFICAKAARILGNFVDEHDLGRVMSNDSGIITERGPDSVRGADVCYYSYTRMPKGALTKGYKPQVPELVVEVRSSNDRWRDIQRKVAEYFEAAVLVVIVLDPEPSKAHIYRADDPPITLEAEDELELPGILDGLRIRVRQFFE
jgi:Uma2 family endonuclease